MPVACWPTSLDPASNHRQMEPEAHSGLTSGLRMHANVHALREYTHTAKVNVVGFLIAPFLSFSFSARYTFLGSLFAKGYQVSLGSPGWLAAYHEVQADFTLASHLPELPVLGVWHYAIPGSSREPLQKCHGLASCSVGLALK